MDEFEIGDLAANDRYKKYKVTHIANGYLLNDIGIIDSVLSAKLIQTAEELRKKEPN